MHRLSDKLLAMLLALLLGLSPLQGAMAASFAASGQGMAMHQMADVDDGAVATSDMASHDCDQCNSGKGCGSQGCSSGHCASCLSCTMAPPLSFSLPTHPATTVTLPLENRGIVSRLTFSLFRPPRA